MEIMIEAFPAFVVIAVVLGVFYFLLREEDKESEVQDFFDSVETEDEERH